MQQVPVILHVDFRILLYSTVLAFPHQKSHDMGMCMLLTGIQYMSWYCIIFHITFVATVVYHNCQTAPVATPCVVLGVSCQSDFEGC